MEDINSQATGADSQVAPMEEPIAGQEPSVKVTFDSAQQRKIDELIKAAQGRAAKALRADNERLRAELAAVPKAPVAQPSEDVALQLATTSAELAALKAAQADSALRETLRAAVAKENFYDQDLAVDLLRKQVRVVDGKPVPINADGTERLGSDFNPLPLEAAAAELAKSKPYLVRGDVRPGAGSKPSNNSFSDSVRLEDMFGKNSNGQLANITAQRNPALYRELKKRAIAKGLI